MADYKGLTIRVPMSLHRKASYVMLDRHAGTFQDLFISLLNDWLENEPGLKPNADDNPLTVRGNPPKANSDNVASSGSESVSVLGDEVAAHWFEVLRRINASNRQVFDVITQQLAAFDELVVAKGSQHESSHKVTPSATGRQQGKVPARTASKRKAS
jgi:hypothetical protein